MVASLSFSCRFQREPLRPLAHVRSPSPGVDALSRAASPSSTTTSPPHLRVASVLKLWGHDVETAFNGPDALGKARSFRPQVVLSGIGMPGMSGYEVVKQLRAERDFDPMVNTSLTGYGQADDHLKTKEAGF